MKINIAQKERIQYLIKSESLDVELETENLVSQGFTKEQASSQIQEEIDLYKEILFEQALKSENEGEIQKGILVGIVVISLIAPIFGITSPIWYVVTLFIAGGLGYLWHKDKPIAGVIGSICFTLILPLFYGSYISNRTSIIRLELLIPIAISAAISYFLGWIIYKIIYK
jgi:hypothetical protein